MKHAINIAKKGITLAILLITTFSYANESFLCITKRNSKKTAIILNEAKKGDKILIVDILGDIIYKENIEKTGAYAKGFDLSNMQQGSYIFKIDTETEITELPFTVNTKNVYINKNLEKTIYKPVFRVENNKVYINKLNVNLKPVNIKVYCSSKDKVKNEKLLYAETITNAKTIEQILDLKNTLNSNYRILINYEGKSVTKIIE